MVNEIGKKDRCVSGVHKDLWFGGCLLNVLQKKAFGEIKVNRREDYVENMCPR